MLAFNCVPHRENLRNPSGWKRSSSKAAVALWVEKNLMQLYGSPLSWKSVTLIHLSPSIAWGIKERTSQQALLSTPWLYPWRENILHKVKIFVSPHSWCCVKIPANVAGRTLWFYGLFGSRYSIISLNSLTSGKKHDLLTEWRQPRRNVSLSPPGHWPYTLSYGISLCAWWVNKWQDL